MLIQGRGRKGRRLSMPKGKALWRTEKERNLELKRDK